MQITSPTVDVVNEPLIVEVKLTVTAALVSLQPPALSFALPCTDTVTARTQVVRVNGTTGVRYTAAIVASPDVAAAEASLAGPLSNGYINANGDLVLRDEQGNEAAVEVNGNMMAAGATTLTWPSAYDWLSATSGSGAIPDTITVQAGSLYSETVRSVDALLVIVADSRAGAPPGNMRIVPISNLCATDQLFLSMVRR